jgi:hypothetical protein
MLSCFLCQTWILEALNEIREELCLAKGIDLCSEANVILDFSKEVNRFVGWAIHSMKEAKANVPLEEKRHSEN